LFGAGTAGYALEGAERAIEMHHRVRGAGCHTHQTTDAELLVEHHHAQAIHRDGLSGACFHAYLALIADVHINGIPIVIDPDARFGWVIFFEVETRAYTLTEVTSYTLIRVGFQ
jgi:hypothetical protein